MCLHENFTKSNWSAQFLNLKWLKKKVKVKWPKYKLNLYDWREKGLTISCLICSKDFWPELCLSGPSPFRSDNRESDAVWLFFFRFGSVPIRYHLFPQFTVDPGWSHSRPPTNANHVLHTLLTYRLKFLLNNTSVYLIPSVSFLQKKQRRLMLKIKLNKNWD